MKEHLIGQEYVWYESHDEPRTLILEKRDVYAKCREKQIPKLQQKLAESNTMSLMLINLLEEYKTWRIKEK